MADACSGALISTAALRLHVCMRACVRACFAHTCARGRTVMLHPLTVSEAATFRPLIRLMADSTSSSKTVALRYGLTMNSGCVFSFAFVGTVLAPEGGRCTSFVLPPAVPAVGPLVPFAIGSPPARRSRGEQQADQRACREFYIAVAKLGSHEKRCARDRGRWSSKRCALTSGDDTTRGIATSTSSFALLSFSS